METSDPGANVISNTTMSNAHSHSGSDLDPEPHRGTFFSETLARRGQLGSLASLSLQDRHFEARTRTVPTDKTRKCLPPLLA